MKDPIEEEAPEVIVTPATEFYLCEPISREMFNLPGTLHLAPKSMPHMPLSVSEVLAIWEPKEGIEDPKYMPGDILIHREQQQNTFAPHPMSPELLFVHSTMIVGKVRGLVKSKNEEE